MPTENQLAKRLANALPDNPRWLETRSMLLNGPCEVLGLEEDRELSFIVLDVRTQSVEVVGRPARQAIARAAEAAGTAAEVVAPGESAEHVASALPEWIGQPAVLHRLSDDRLLPPLDGAVRLLSEEEVAALQDVPDELRQELALAGEMTAIAATLVDGKAVSFCYPGSVTETLWDASIDTLEGSRRHGHAASCVRFVIELMRKRGKEPIWGALEDNIASMQLAAKLGFVPVDRIFVFERP